MPDYAHTYLGNACRPYVIMRPTAPPFIAMAVHTQSRHSMRKRYAHRPIIHTLPSSLKCAEHVWEVTTIAKYLNVHTHALRSDVR
jgi:hypothetical protein